MSPFILKWKTENGFFGRWKRERDQIIPKYAEMCRRFLADEEDFSEENILAADIEKRFENIELDTCVEEIVSYISYR